MFPVYFRRVGLSLLPRDSDNRPGSLLYTASRAEIEREVRSLIASEGRSGYILGADCSLHGDLPEERIRWVVEAARKNG